MNPTGRMALTLTVLLMLLHLCIATDPWTSWSCDELTPDLCHDLRVEEGSLTIRGIDVHYWKYVSNEQPKKVPIVTLHGGPAFTHNYLLPLKQLACRGHDVIFYDQAGCGSSSFPPGTTVADFPWLFEPNYYSDVELPLLLSHWRLVQYHLLGHSWGTILAQLFVHSITAMRISTAPPASLTLSGPVSDARLYIAEQWNPQDGSIGSLPPFVQRRIYELEQQNAYISTEYTAIVDALTSSFTCRTAPPPDCLSRSIDGVATAIYVGLQGPSEFALGGVLADFNSTALLPQISMPTLLTAGKYDTIRPPVVDVLEQNIPLAERFEFFHSGHLSMIDDAGLMNDVVSDFLSRVEGSKLNFEVRRWATESSVQLEPSNSIEGTRVSWWSLFVGALAGGFIASSLPSVREFQKWYRKHS